MTANAVLAKGKIADSACRSAVVFGVTPWSLLDGKLPLVPVGKIHVDHIEMVTPNQEGDLPTVTLLGSGRCTGVHSDSWVSNCEDAGGCLLGLHLLWTYCSGDDPTSYRSAIGCCLDFLACVVSRSALEREHLIQLHGFHIVGTCLSKLTKRDGLIDTDIVARCFKLLEALGCDAWKGDGVASALQGEYLYTEIGTGICVTHIWGFLLAGLLFDFGIWGQASGSVRLYLLTTLAANSAWRRQVGKHIGTQRLLGMS